MRITVDVTIPDPLFPEKSLFASPHGHVFHVLSIRSVLERTSMVYTGSGGPGGAPHLHMYTLVVQRSNLMRTGSVLIADERTLGDCRPIKNWKEAIAAPDAMNNIHARLAPRS